MFLTDDEAGWREAPQRVRNKLKTKEARDQFLIENIKNIELMAELDRSNLALINKKDIVGSVRKILNSYGLDFEVVKYDGFYSKNDYAVYFVSLENKELYIVDAEKYERSFAFLVSRTGIIDESRRNINNVSIAVTTLYVLSKYLNQQLELSSKYKS